MATLLDPITCIKGIGPKKAKRLQKIGITNIKDLLIIFPKRYLNLKALKPIAKITPSDRKQLITGKITNLTLFRSPKKKMPILEGIIQDSTGSLRFHFFNQPYLYSALKNREVFFYGRLKLRSGQIVLENPLYEFSYQKNYKEKMLPIYPEVGGFSSKQIRHLIQTTLRQLSELPQLLPSEIIRRFGLLSFEYALKTIHRPQSLQILKKAKKTWAVLEMLGFIAQTQVLRKQKSKYTAPALSSRDLSSFIKKLPFKLTSDQKKALKEITQDLSKKHPASRLLNGDVGSGKTIVAFLAMINTALNKKQAVLMAPTEILAYQHFSNFIRFFGHQFKTVLLTNIWRLKSFGKPPSRLRKISDIKKADLIFGTHALLEEKVPMPRLALVVIDEQQRFGVKQRAKLRRKNQKENILPHLLMLTATPIPRTLTLILLKNLEISFLKTTPFKRKTQTKVILSNQIDQAYRVMQKELQKGNQAFIICPIIEKKETLDFDNRKAAEEEFGKIKELFPRAKVGLLHGKMKPKEKEEAISKFKKGELQILVATSVVEVGVDIAKAAVLIVETAERFGLSQLHQLRGRIGRAGQESFCFFVASSKNAARKLQILEKTQDGFRISAEDLKQRGPGEILGEKQHGFLKFRFADLSNQEFIQTVNKISSQLSSKDWKKLLLLK